MAALERAKALREREQHQTKKLTFGEKSSL